MIPTHLEASEVKVFNGFIVREIWICLQRSWKQIFMVEFLVNLKNAASVLSHSPVSNGANMWTYHFYRKPQNLVAEKYDRSWVISSCLLNYSRFVVLIGFLFPPDFSFARNLGIWRLQCIRSLLGKRSSYLILSILLTEEWIRGGNMFTCKGVICEN